MINLHLAGRVLLAAFFVLASSRSYAQSHWPTTRFRVVGEEPVDIADPRFSALIDTEKEIDAGLAHQIASHLQLMAVEYEKMGFRSPSLDTVTLEDGTLAYRIYMTDYDEDRTIAYTSGPWSINGACIKGNVDDSDRYILFDYSRMVTNGAVQDAELEHLGHELFHAVQQAYEMFRKCGTGRWLLEGTAQAVGIDVMYDRMSIEPNRASQAPRRWGVRNYASPLRVGLDSARKQDGYGTSSLWRYIGEWVANKGAARKKTDSSPGTAEVTPDYSYLHRFFEAGFEGPATEQSELEWLDTQVSKELSVDLSDVFARMLPTLLAFPLSPRITRTTTTEAQAQERWIKAILGTCKTVTLNPPPAGAPDTASVVLPKGGAACVKVMAQSLGPNAQINIQTSSDTKADIEQIQVAAIGGDLVSVSTPVMRHQDKNTGRYEYFGDWTFAAGSPYAIYIITNLSQTAQNTTALPDQSFQFSIPNWYASTGGGGATASTRPTNKQPTTTDEMAKLAAAGFESATHQSGRSVAVGRDEPDADPYCEAQSKEWNLCGPQLRVALMTTPGIFGDTDLVSGAGGFLGRSAGVNLGTNSMGADEQERQHRLFALNSILSADLASISISAPLVDYGYKGNLNGVAITVMMADGKSASSVEMSPGSGCGRIWIPNGTIHVEEYTPKIFRGTFRGDFILDGSVEMGPQCTIAHEERVGIVAGGYTVPAPWKTDPAALREGPAMELIMDQTKEDVTGILLAMPEEMRQQVVSGKGGQRICEDLGYTSEELNVMGIRETCANRVLEVREVEVLPDCTCACEAREAELKTDHCPNQCEDTWNICVTMDGSDEPSDAEMAEMREYLKTSGLPDDLVDQYVEMMRIMPPENRKIFLEQLRSQ